jgi:serine/threonine-protein kinase HipA
MPLSAEEHGDDAIRPFLGGLLPDSTPSNRILKPPTREFRGFAENEHFCLELARELGLGAVRSRVMHFGSETAIVVDRFDRHKANGVPSIHQEDACQALRVMPTEKYEAQGGPGVADIVSLVRDYSTRADEDIARFMKATALNWAIAATDAHAKNHALLIGANNAVRLAPFYDIISFLPYTEPALHRVMLAMRIGSKYLVRQVGIRQWESLARDCRMERDKVIGMVAAVLDDIPAAAERVKDRCLGEGLERKTVVTLARLISARASTARAQF